VRRTQKGNNNAYCQDNEISWFDWSLLEKHADVLRFTEMMIRFRMNLDVHVEDHDLSLNEFLRKAQIEWHGQSLNQPDYGHDSHGLAMTVRSLDGSCLLHIILNNYWKAQSFALPAAPGGVKNGWRQVIDTFRPSPDDIHEPAKAPYIKDTVYLAHPRSVVVLVAEIPQSTL
jgi:isoamylase